MVIDQSGKFDFMDLEIQILRLVVGYCCYYSHGFSLPPPANDLNILESEKEYFALIKKLSTSGDLRKENRQHKLSSIIKNKQLKKIIISME
ncbi:hypothetical protein [Tolypothrix sp. VBCCA 56010]|uniref:hypothetical protein n=1 Tax=Tolypothrix sp. VBCCA 56010 TaxID=3137731 RepID=UPI003D7CAD7E